MILKLLYSTINNCLSIVYIQLYKRNAILSTFQVHQMLILCKNRHGIIVFLALRKYFSSKIYSKKDISVDVDSITGICKYEKSVLQEFMNCSEF